MRFDLRTPFCPVVAVERRVVVRSEHPLGKHTDCLFHRYTTALAAALFARCVQRDADQ